LDSDANANAPAACAPYPDATARNHRSSSWGPAHADSDSHKAPAPYSYAEEEATYTRYADTVSQRHFAHQNDEAEEGVTDASDQGQSNAETVADAKNDKISSRPGNTSVYSDFPGTP
jgi:hypothetical protein